MSIDSAPGRGTTVTVLLPAAELSASRAAEREPSPPGAGETIVVVEDDEPLRSVVCRVLADGGYRVLASATADEALSRREEICGADLVLTDVVMPGMSGADLSARLAEGDTTPAVLYMSGHTAEAIARAGVDAGPDAPVLEKPFTADELLWRVHERLRGVV